MTPDEAQRAINLYVWEYNHATESINEELLLLTRGSGRDPFDWIVRFLSYKLIMLAYGADVGNHRPLGTGRVSAVVVNEYSESPEPDGGIGVRARVTARTPFGNFQYGAQAIITSNDVTYYARGSEPVVAHRHGPTGPVHIGVAHLPIRRNPPVPRRRRR